MYSNFTHFAVTLVLIDELGKTKATNPQEDSEADVEGQRLQKKSDMPNSAKDLGNPTSRME